MSDGGQLQLDRSRQVSFNSAGTESGDESISGYEGDSDNSEFGSSTTASAYFEPGESDVDLNVSDALGNVGTATGTVVVPDSNYVDATSEGSGEGYECWEVWLVWRVDGIIIQEEYLFDLCCNSEGCNYM